jgi:hypothetical protein
MMTETATKVLLDDFSYFDDLVDDYPPTADGRTPEPLLSMIQAAHGHLDAARRCGRAWDWDGSERHLRAAYAALGADYPAGETVWGATGYAWHVGCHPAQGY